MQNGSVKLSDGSAVTFRLDTGAAQLQLDYWLNGVAVSERIPLDRTRPRYGGVRWWFRCPSCARRCAKLYLPPGAECFACRRCHRLAYQSQREGPAERLAAYSARRSR